MFLRCLIDFIICSFWISSSQVFPAQSWCPEIAINLDPCFLIYISNLFMKEFTGILSLFTVSILHGPDSVITSTYAILWFPLKYFMIGYCNLASIHWIDVQKAILWTNSINYLSKKAGLNLWSSGENQIQLFWWKAEFIAFQ